MSAVSVNARAALLLVQMCPSAGPPGSTGAHLFSLSYAPKSSRKSQMEHKDRGSPGDPKYHFIIILQTNQKDPKLLRLSRCYRCFPSVHQGQGHYCRQLLCRTRLSYPNFRRTVTFFFIFFNTRKRNPSKIRAVACESDSRLSRSS